MNAPVKKFKQSSRTGTAEPVTQALSSIAFYSELAAASSGQRFIVTAALSSYAKKNSPRSCWRYAAMEYVLVAKRELYWRYRRYGFGRKRFGEASRLRHRWLREVFQENRQMNKRHWRSAKQGAIR